MKKALSDLPKYLDGMETQPKINIFKKINKPNTTKKNEHENSDRTERFQSKK